MERWGKLLVVAVVMFASTTAWAGSPDIVISQFRTRGPAGGNDEFIELFNASGAAVSIGGWTVNGSSASSTSGTVRATITAGTVLQPGQFYLLTNNGTGGYSGSVPGNQTYATGIADGGGLAVVNAGTVVDQVGMSTTTFYKEGSVLTAVTSGTENWAYQRKAAFCGFGQDTDDNASDFVKIGPAAPHNLGSSTCASPGTCQASPGTCGTDGVCTYTPAGEGALCDDQDLCTDGDACNASGACVGTPKNCVNPEAGCVDANYLRTYANPRCAGGVCISDSTDTLCEFGCDPAARACRADPCIGVVCDQSPGQCYEAQGTCSGGVCSYAPLGPLAGCDDTDSCTTGDLCDGEGACVGSPVVCVAPAPTCRDGAVVVFMDGSCVGGNCSFPEVVTSCQYGCNPLTVQCNPDPCQGVVCDAPPNTDCWDPAGTCDAGACVYTPRGVGYPCSDGQACTSGDACNAEMTCGGTTVVCAVRPPMCVPGSISVSFGTGTCNAGTGDCDYPETQTYCERGCDSATGLCKGDPCEGVVCDPPPSPCRQAGVCVDGTCTYDFLPVGAPCDDANACTTGDVCDGGDTCVGTVISCTTPPSTVCYAPTGTCDAGVCSYEKAPVGTVCNDGQACTLMDQCDALQQCVGTPVECGERPPECFNGASRTFSNGVCRNDLGSCEYTTTDTQCAQGCDPATGLCKNDLCAGVTCNTPPNPLCFQAAGTCNPANGQCVYTALAVGSPCSDGNPCTLNDACTEANQCVGTELTCDTPPAGSCYYPGGHCENGACVYGGPDAGTPCDDGDLCTTGDACDAQHQCAGTRLACDHPINQCYEAQGTCDAGSCTYTPKAVGATCDDGDLCTAGDACDDAHQCLGTALACNTPPDAQCYEAAGTCDAGNCVYTPRAVGLACDDGDACTSGDQCDGSHLCRGSAMACDTPPNAQCFDAAGTCSGGTCSYTPKAPGTGCDDGNACTVTDQCDAGGQCAGAAMACNTPPDGCHEAAGTCSGGTCTYPLKAAGTACDDGNACTDADQCSDQGACSGTAKVCDTPPNSQCYEAAGTCTAGSCTYAAKATGTTCSDGDLCTEGDACDGTHACKGTAKVCTPPAPTCDAGVSHISHDGVCNSRAGTCTFTVTDVTCKSGCGTNGLCKSGVIISQFRTRGPGATGSGSASDEFVEWYNGGDADADIGGWALWYSSNSGTLGLRATVPAGTRMPPKSFYLIVNNTASTGYSGTVAADLTYGTGIADNGGIAIKDAAGALVDQVGMAATSGYKEGTTLAPMTTSDSAKAYLRKTAVCGPDQDTDVNSADFALVTPVTPHNSKSCRPACAGSECLDRTACKDANTSTAYTAGTCTAGQCGWTTTDTPCAFGCDAATGQCKADPCLGVVCNTPPNTACYEAAGTCSAGTCSYAPKTGSACDDGNACTTGDVCAADGSCAGAAVTCNTPPDVQCYEPAGTCEAGTGKCLYTPKATGTTCNDGSLCTDSDACGADHVCAGAARVCVPPSPTCEAGDVSRTWGGGTCNAADGQCTFTSTDQTCANGCDAGSGLCIGDPCLGVTCTTPPDTCHAEAGTCTAGTCQYAQKAAGAGCDDGNLCTVLDKCAADASCAGTAMVCNTPPDAQCYDAAGTCNAGACEYTAKGEGTPCDDGDACTDADGCTAAHACAGSPRTCDAPPNLQCYEPLGTCSAGTCTYTPKAEAAACDDGNPCTEGDACAADHACAGTAKTCRAPAPTCADGISQLYQSACDTADGACKDSPLNTVACAAGCAADGFCVRGVLISEFRTRGPAGGNDEYIELFNASDVEVDLKGWKLDGSNNTGGVSTRITFGEVRMPAKSFLLLTNSGTGGYSGTVAGDVTYSSGISDPGGLALKDAAGAIVDQVGMSAGSAFKEGTPLVGVGSSDSGKAFRRKTLVCGPDQDTNNNEADFLLVGDPDPKNRATCRPACAGEACPDRVACSADGKDSVVYTAGACTAGACQWTTAATTCPAGCVAATGLCKDPCEGVVCNTPADPQCQEATGTCGLGTCTYAYKGVGTGCDDGDACTLDDQCGADHACKGTARTCTPPAPQCVGDTSRTFTNGHCAVDGSCQFQTVDNACENGCNAASGLCNGDPCAGVVCDPPPSSCHEAGVCVGGSCQYAFKSLGAACDDGDACSDADACGPDHLCKGQARVCLPPAPACQADGSSRIFSGGACTAGSCFFDQEDKACPSGCDAASGLCVGDPCVGVACNQPPDQCHKAVGTCSGGTCTYDLKPVGAACDDQDSCTALDGCDAAGACAGKAIACDVAPATTCEGDASRVFQAPGSCQSGTCAYPHTDTPCADGCDPATGLCKDLCATVTCNTPPGPCHAANGACSHGTCTYPALPDTATCDDGDTCTVGDHCDGSGVCVAGAPNPLCGDLGPTDNGPDTADEADVPDVAGDEAPDAGTDTATPDLGTDPGTPDAPVAEAEEPTADVPVTPDAVVTDTAKPDAGKDVVVATDTGADAGKKGGGGGCSAGDGSAPFGLFSAIGLLMAAVILRRRREA